MSIACRHCGVKLFGDEVDKGACEHCQLSPAPRPDAAATTIPRAPRRAHDDPHAAAWVPVRVGTSLLFWSVLLNLVGLVAATMNQLMRASSPAALPLGLLAMGTGGLGALMGLGGSLLCCLVPRRSGLGGRAAFAAGAQVVALAAGGALAYCLFRPGGARRWSSDTRELLALVAICSFALLALTAALAHFLLLAGVSRVNGDPALAQKFLIYPIAVFAISAAVATALVLAGAATRGRETIVLAGLLLNVVLNFIFTLYLLGLYRDLHELLSPAETFDVQ